MASVSKCDNCYTLGSSEKPLKACSRCKAVKYCSKECQTANWKLHKELCKKNAAHAEALQNTLNPAHRVPLPDGMTLPELDQRLEKWIHYHSPTIMAATIHALRIPEDFTNLKTRVLHIIVSPRTDHDGRPAKYFRVREANAYSVEEARRFPAPWAESIDNIEQMREESERMKRGSVAFAGVTCPPLGVQMVPFGSMRRMSEIQVVSNWKERLVRDVEQGKKFSRWDN